MKRVWWLAAAVLAWSGTAGLAWGQTTATAPATGPDQNLQDPATLADGAHVRVVWMQARPQDRHFLSNELTLAGYDSKDGKNARTILATPANYFRPQLTGDGTKIVYSSRKTNTIRVVNFDGTGDREVATGGYAIEVWYDAAAKTDYVYMHRQPGSGDFTLEGEVVRFPLNAPDKTEVVWNQSAVHWNQFQLSRDGKTAAIEAPWPRCITAAMPNGDWTIFGRGCYPSIAPDNSRLAMHMDGIHKGFVFARPGSDVTWKIPANTAPGFKGRKIHCPHWSNHTQFVTLTGPHPDGSTPGDNENGVEVYLAKFSDDFSRIAGWAKLTTNNVPELYPDAWIAGGDNSAVDLAKLPAGKPSVAAATMADTWPGSAEGLVWVWDNARADNKVRDAATGKSRGCTAEPQGDAVPGPHATMDLAGGSFVADDNAEQKAPIAAVRDARAFALELTYTPPAAVRRPQGAVFALGKPGGPPNLSLGIWRGNLGVFVANRIARGGRLGGDWENLGKAVPGKPIHIVITGKPGTLHAYIDGKRTVANADWSPDFKLWRDGPMRFGADVDNRDPAGGMMEAVALYDRFLGEEEVARKHTLVRKRLAARQAPEPLVVEATLQKTLPAPDAQTLGTYKRALVVYDYQVNNVLKGAYAGKTLRVAHWAVLDRKPSKLLAARKIGDKVTLTLDKFDDHAELKSEWRDEGEASELELFYDSARAPAPVDKRTAEEKVRDAILEEDLDLLKELIAANPKLVAAEAQHNGRKLRPLELSAANTVIWRRGQRRISEYLLEQGAPCDIFIAARAGLRDRVEKYLADDARLLAAADKDGLTALQRAALTEGYSRDCEEVMDFLLRQGAKPDICVAARLGMKDAVADMLKQNAALAKTTLSNGTTPLHWAVRPMRNHDAAPAVVELLLQNGADVAAKDPSSNDMLPLHHAAGWGAPKAVVDLLLKHKADPNALAGGDTPWTALDFATAWGEPELAAHLRKLGAKESGNRRR